jgi:DNA-binding protein HU-beta
MATSKKKSATVSTSNIIASICEKHDNLPKKMIKELIQTFLDSIEENVTKGCKVRIDKLGILQVKDRSARKGRNPQTGEAIKIPASKKVAFRVSASLKEAVGVKKKKATAVKKKK